MKYVAVDEDGLSWIKAAMKDLYMERRIGGDRMRDLAQGMDQALKNGIKFDDRNWDLVRKLPAKAKLRRLKAKRAVKDRV